MKTSTRRRIDALKRHRALIRVGPIALVDTTKWPDEDRLAFLAAEGDEADAILERCAGFRRPSGGPNEITLIVISHQPGAARADSEDAPPVAAPTLSAAPEPEPDIDPLANVTHELANREARRQEAEADRVIREREARRVGRWY